MTGTRRLLIAGGFAALALVPAAARGEGAPCNDCCQMPCVEAEIRYATKMQQWYRSQAGLKNLTREAYEAGEKAKAEELSKERAKDVGKLTGCRWNLPDPKTDPMAVRQWSAARWSMTSDEKGNISYNFSLKTDTKSCLLNEKQVTLLHGITPCSGLADAAEKHERFHVTTCEKRKGRTETMAEAAADEVGAYDVELKELNALRDALQKVCNKGTCKDKDTKVARVQLEKELDELKQVLAKRGGKGK
jgi:hypothetical protein